MFNKDGLALNIDMYNNDLDIDLAKSVGEYFKLDTMAMNKIQEEVVTAVKQWDFISYPHGKRKA